MGKRGGKGGNGNLISADQLTEEELRRMTSNGGKKSAEVRRRKKTMREALEFLMYNCELSPALKMRMEEEGIPEEDMNHQMAITRSLISKAEAGDVQAYNAICAMIGEKPAEKIDVNGGVETNLKIRYVTEGEGDEDFPSSEAEVDTEREV